MDTQDLSADQFPFDYDAEVPKLNFYGQYIKRPVEIIIVVGLIIFFSPLMAVIALSIRLFSPGPVFYRQVRAGKNGVSFNMLKFRSMKLENAPDLHREYVQRLIRENVNPKELASGTLKLQSDPRITGMGKILRKYSLDEIPQLFNVIRGEMSLVGPRPPLPYELEVYEDWHKLRLAIRPGITGLWQVIAHNTCSFEEMVRLDLNYIKTMSLWLDFKIIILTPIEMIRGKGSG